ncbi:MAG: polyprenyl synthetase family protein [Chloroflexi bacterium]|nr:polyprenyl synthetase family protein [Chloroflexota bacterium]
MNAPEVFGKYRPAIDRELAEVLAERELPLYDMLRYHLGWVDREGNARASPSGKALRPTLCLLACEAVSGEFEMALPAAAAVELVHNYSLIHDDIQDDDRERRHAPTVWSLWGKPQAINAGTAMRMLASLALLRLNEHSVPLQKQLRGQQLIDESTLKLIEGQYLDIDFENRFDITVDNYLDMIFRKTGALIACSLEIGALVGTKDERTIAGFREIGRNLGLAFQIKDDILGIWGDEKKTGKPLAGDIRRKKKTLPIVYGLQDSHNEARQSLIKVYRNGMVEEDGIRTVLGILESLNVQARSRKLAETYRDRALKTLDELELSPQAKRDLEEVSRFLVERSF